MLRKEAEEKQRNMKNKKSENRRVNKTLIRVLTIFLYIQYKTGSPYFEEKYIFLLVAIL